MMHLKVSIIAGAALIGLAAVAGLQAQGLFNAGETYGNPTAVPGAPTTVAPTTARGPLLLNIDQLSKPGDTNYTILATDRTVAHTAMSVARTDTLPAASALNPGQHVLIIDLYGVASGVKTLTIQRAGSDTVNGSTSSAITSARSGQDCVSDGISAWQCNPPVASGVSLFATRSGNVTPQADDYAAFNGLAVPGNCTVAPSVAANNVTFAIKQADGATDPTGSAPCVVNFPSGTLTSGATVARKVTAATSVTLNSGSTLGVASGVSANVWAVFIDTGATAVIGVGVMSNSTTIFPLDETGVITSTACAACATATATGTIYSTAAQAGAAYRIAGYSQFTLASAGVWASGPIKVRNYTAGMPRPGQPTGRAAQPAVVVTQTTNATATYVDTLCTVTITPSSAANFIWTSWNGQTVIATGGDAGKYVLRRGGTPVGPEQSAGGFTGATNAFVPVGGAWMDNPQTNTAVTYTVAEKMLTGTGGVTFPHATAGCSVAAQEIMG